METTFRQILERASAELGIEVDERRMVLMQRLKDLLVQENEKVNLTGIKDDLGIAVKHFADSLTVLMVEGARECGSFVDIGTGAGFPGLVLAMMLPEAKGVLVDSVGKKVNFVSRAVIELGLTNVTAVTARAEDLARESIHREKYGLAVIRGVSSVSESAEYCIPFLKKGGLFVAMKGPGADTEIDDGKAAAFALGAKITGVRKLTLPYDQGDRVLVVAEKTSPTPGRYPRKAGEPHKRPISRSSGNKVE
ncbi:MAG TPA: 16S rRNA (guanine(527)-N(7))-methyltransferase RsmG [Bacillota bacterium]|nr:16S rRNA (guanine(527)-N(7))-methyltransferase RsmG [Bacillota bacterium]